MLRKTSLFLLLAALLPAFAAPASAAETYKSFWLTETISGRTVGPIVNKPGNRFTLDGVQYIVMESASGEINFAEARKMELAGPFELVEQRVIPLGSRAYVFTRILDFTGEDPSRSEATVTQAVRAPAQQADKPWLKDMPERWVLGPVPSTNPGAYRESKTWSLDPVQWAPGVSLFVEPLYERKYDWKLGGHLGSTESTLELTRYGIAGQWRGFLAEAGLGSSGKVSGTLVRNGTLLSDLKLDNIDGWFAAIGYQYAFVIEGPWTAVLGARAEYQSFDASMSASVAAENLSYLQSEITVDGTVVESSSETSYDYGFTTWKDDTSWDEISAALTIAIEYDEWYWGLGGCVIIDCFSDFSSDGRIPLLGDTFELDAERSAPISFRARGWYSPIDNLTLEASLTMGAETSLRLAAGIFF